MEAILFFPFFVWPEGGRHFPSRQTSSYLLLSPSFSNAKINKKNFAKRSMWQTSNEAVLRWQMHSNYTAMTHLLSVGFSIFVSLSIVCASERTSGLLKGEHKQIKAYLWVPSPVDDKPAP